ARLSSLQDRKGTLEKQIAEAELIESDIGGSFGATGGATGEPIGDAKGAAVGRGVQARRAQLDALLTRYSDKYPDVVALKEEIKTLEAAAAREADPSTQPSSKDASRRAGVAGGGGLRAALLANVADATKEIAAVRAIIAELTQKVAGYQSRIDNT